jgi:hypothetical protein
MLHLGTLNDGASRRDSFMNDIGSNCKKTDS